MHAFAIARETAAQATTSIAGSLAGSLRDLLAEQGGRRRLVEALEDRLGSVPCLDDQQLLLRASALFEDRRLGELAL